MAKQVAVQTFLDELDHPLKAEVLAVREIIRGTDDGLTEEIKWNAPTFSYGGYLVTFNLHAKDRVHLVFHNGAILDDQGGFLEGDYPDRRMAYFTDMADIEAKRPALEAALREWIELKDGEAA